LTDARESAWMPVPCESALTQTGGAPLQEKKLSQAIPPARGEASASAWSRTSPSAALELCLRDLASALASPKVPSHWGWMPLPG
jgi:hypothetical protein